MEDLSLEALIMEAEKKAKEHYELHPEERNVIKQTFYFKPIPSIL